MPTDLNHYWDRILQGDEKALEKLYKQTFSFLVRYAETLTGDMQLAEEAVQDVILKIWQNRSVIIIQGSFKAYLVKAVHNEALNAIRQRNSNKESVNQPCSESLWQFISDHYDLDEQFINMLYADETHERIRQAVEELPEKCRQVFRMSRFELMTVQEIAEKLNLSVNTVKTHISLALQRLSKILQNK